MPNSPVISPPPARAERLALGAFAIAVFAAACGTSLDPATSSASLGQARAAVPGIPAVAARTRSAPAVGAGPAVDGGASACPADAPVVCPADCCPKETTCGASGGCVVDAVPSKCPAKTPVRCAGGAAIACVAAGKTCPADGSGGGVEAACPVDAPVACFGGGACCPTGSVCVVSGGHASCVLAAGPAESDTPPKIDSGCSAGHPASCGDACCLDEPSCGGASCACPSGSIACGGLCCAPGSACVGGHCQPACADPAFPSACGGECCAAGFACEAGRCGCGGSHPVACGGACCLAGATCGKAGCTCPGGAAACGPRCCDAGQACSGDPSDPTSTCVAK